MSQAGIINVAGGGGGGTPVQTVSTQSGTAVPVANDILIDSFDSIENNDNGLITRGGVAAGDPPGTGAVNEVSNYLTNRIVVTATTSDGGGQTQVVTLMTPTNLTTVTFKVLIAAYDAVLDNAAGGELIGVARKSAGVVTIISTNDTFDESDVGLNAIDWDVIQSAGVLQMQFVGIAGQTISWKALFEYIQVG